MSVAADINIHCLHLRAPRAQRPSATASLHTALWPQATLDEWYFIRRIEVRAPALRIGAVAAADAQALLGAAADGESPSALYAPAVRFASLARLLARLSTDLLNDRAAHTWYWRRWSHLFRLPPGEAVARLWEAYVAELTEVTALLAARGELYRVWQVLGAVQGERLLHVLVRALGLAPAVAGVARDARSPPSPPLPRSYLIRWREPLACLSEGDPRARLAACLVALEWQPTSLLSDRAGGFTTALAAVLTGETAARVLPTPSEPRRGESAKAHPQWRPPWSSAGSRRSPRPGEQHPGVVVGDSFQSPTEISGAAGVAAHAPAGARPTDAAASLAAPRPSSTGTPQLRARGENEVAQGEAAHRQDRPAPTETCAELPVDFDGLYTREGGLFLLLNFLARPEAQTLIAGQGGMAALPDGWAWLYRLGLALGLTADSSAAVWLGRQMQSDDLIVPADVPPLPGGTALLALGAQLYGDAGADARADAGEAGPPWGSNLLARPALVRSTRSHLDICYPLVCASLPVRVAGLDIDPGWLPWLGRVVAFHYVSSPLFAEAEPT
ncbi:MAG: hypothetical protein P8Y53_03595 [Pseudolabrys sp.]